MKRLFRLKKRSFIRVLWIWVILITAGCSGWSAPPTNPRPIPPKTPTAVQSSTVAISALPPPTLTPPLPSPTSTRPPAAPSLDVSQLVEQASWGKGTIAGGAFSPDGKRVGLFTTQGVTIYDAVNFTQLDFFANGSTFPVDAFSPDWSLLATGSASTITIMRMADKSTVTHLVTNQGKVTRVLFSPDGRYLASMVMPPGEEVYTPFLEVYDVTHWKLVGSWKAQAIPDIAFALDSCSIYSFNMEGIRRWQLPSGSPVPVEKDWYPVTLAASKDGKFFASVEPFFPAIVIRRVVDDTQVSRMLLGVNGTAGPIFFSPDDTQLVAFTSDGLVNIWQIADGSLVRSFSTTSTGGQLLAMSPDGQTVLFSSSDGPIFYRLSDGQILQRLAGYMSTITQAALSPRGDRLAALCLSANQDDNSLLVWSFPQGKVLYLLNSVGAINFYWSPDGERLALAGWDGHVRVLSAPDGTVIQTLAGHSEQVQSVAWSPDGSRIASSSMQSVKVWRVSDGTLLTNLFVPPGWVDNLLYSPDGKLLAGLDANGTIQVWQASDGNKLTEFSFAAYGNPYEIEMAPDSSFVVEAKETQVLFWHWNDPNPYLKLPVTRADSLGVSPDGALLACGLTDGSIQLWQIADGQLLRTLTGGFDGISSLDFSNDGRRLVSASRDGTIRVWGIQ